jgi:glycosyltransferase involved in cell wall biosynthesis
VAEQATRLAVVGLSEGPTCGAHDHAVLLTEALTQRGICCSMHWHWRRDPSLSATRAEIKAWTRGLPAELAQAAPDAILLHYSIFSYSHRGIPLFVHPVLRALRKTGMPILTVMHEFVYPWRLGDWRGNLWALTQRAALIEAVRSSSGLIVTTDRRATWFASKRWLAQRPTVMAPVFSNLPAPSVGHPATRHGRLVGLFGYSYQGAALSVVLDALRLLADRGVALELRLLGGPGRTSEAGESWLSAARERRLEERLSFSGILPADELANALGECDVLLFADTPGPSSRKGTLAGSLASGRPVLALDGPQRWAQMIDARAAEVVEPRAEALAEGLEQLLGDEGHREALGARGRAFAEQMGAGHSAELVIELLDQLLPARPARPAWAAS